MRGASHHTTGIISVLRFRLGALPKEEALFFSEKLFKRNNSRAKPERTDAVSGENIGRIVDTKIRAGKTNHDDEKYQTKQNIMSRLGRLHV